MAVLLWIMILIAKELKKYKKNTFIVVKTLINLPLYVPQLCSSVTPFNLCLCGTEFCMKDISTYTAPNLDVYISFLKFIQFLVQYLRVV